MPWSFVNEAGLLAAGSTFYNWDFCTPGMYLPITAAGVALEQHQTSVLVTLCYINDLITYPDEVLLLLQDEAHTEFLVVVSGFHIDMTLDRFMRYDSITPQA